MSSPEPSRSSARATALFLLLVAALVVIAILYGSRQRRGGTVPTQPGAAGSDTAAAPAEAAATSDSAATPAEKAVARDFRAALEEARGLRDPMVRSREFGRILLEWLGQEPDAALAYVRQLRRDSAEFTDGLRLTLDFIGRTDPDRALQLAAEYAKTAEQRAFYSSFFAQLAERDPAAAAQRLGMVPAGLARENAVRAVAGAWARRDFDAALHWAEGLPAGERAAAVESTLGELSSTDPLRAIEMAQRSLSGPALDRTLGIALHQLTTVDASSAAAVVALLPAGETQRQAAIEVVDAMAARNPADAVAWAARLPSGTTQTTALLRSLELWTRRDPDAAQRYVQTLPGPLQSQAGAAVAAELAGRNPQAAIAWARTLPDDAARGSAVARAVDTWARHDAAAAAHWVAAQSVDSLGGQPESALNGALSYWALRDAEAVRGFVATLPREAQTSAATFVAPLLAQQQPAATLAWAAGLPDAGARDAAVAAAYARWLDNAPAAARQWLAGASLAPELKSRLQTMRP